MKISLVAVNSRHIHSALGVRYIKAAILCSNPAADISVLERNINQPVRDALEQVVSSKADVIGFSCYIFNIDYVMRLAADVKKCLSESKIIFGGPEASYRSEDLLRNHDFIDYVLTGEGEQSFPKLMQALELGVRPHVDGLSYRERGEIVSYAPQQIPILDELASPYDKEALNFASGRIAYYESSRGCPYCCSYCLSSAEQGVRYFSLDRVKEDLLKLFASDVRQIKFVDRTFNANKARAREIINFIIDTAAQGIYRPKNFHFEVSPDLFDEGLYNILSKAPAGLIQLEAGIQSFHKPALAAVNRHCDLQKTEENLSRLMSLGNVHLHVGLIAGLPEEPLEIFADSFNRAYKLNAHQLQLGFLKLLHGTKLRSEATAHSYEFSSYAPYQILRSKWLSAHDVFILAKIEELVDRYYNGGRFTHSSRYLIACLNVTPFSFYRVLSDWCEGESIKLCECSLEALYLVVAKFAHQRLSDEQQHVLHNLLVFDYLSTTVTRTTPKRLAHLVPDNSRSGDFLRDPRIFEEKLPHRHGSSFKHTAKDIFVQPFTVDVKMFATEGVASLHPIKCVFDYSIKHPVTDQYWWTSAAVEEEIVS